jgi:hypothetical protein
MKLNRYLLLIAFFIFCSCQKKDDPVPDPNITFEATLSGASEVPANWSTASGTATATYNTSSKALSLTITYTGITPSYGHLHKGAAGVNGPAVFHFVGLSSPIYYTCPPFDAFQETDLLNNLFYINLHTAAYPDGEIRGQLIKQ